MRAVSSSTIPGCTAPRLPEPARFEGYQSDVLCRARAGWLGPPAGDPPPRPWFCCLSLEAPHPPYDAPAAGIAPRDPSEIVLPANVPRGGEVEARARRELAGYYAHIEATDRAIGRLLDSPAAADSILVVTSAHGDMHGAHGLFRKGWPHEESIRVPLLVRGAASLPGPGSGADGPGVGTISHERPCWIFPRSTLRDRNPLPLRAQGWNALSPTLPGSAAPSFRCPPSSACRTSATALWRGVRTPGRKLVLNADGTPWLFFDLEQDPLEMRNLAGDPRARARAGGFSRCLA